MIRFDLRRRAALAVALALLMSAGCGPKGLPWSGDPEKTLAEAKGKRPVLVAFLSDQFALSRRIDEYVLRDPLFIEEAKRWSLVKVNPESYPRGRDEVEALMKRLGVQSIPTLLVFDSSGRARKELTLIEATPAAAYVEALRSVR